MIYIKLHLVNYEMKKGTKLLIIFWLLLFLSVAWLLPLMARQSSALDSFLSFCVSFIK